MTVSIEVSNERLATLKAKAAAQKLVLEEPEPAQPGKPFKTGRGLLAKYGPAPSAE